MILIADSGATKTHWILIDNKQVTGEIYTSGFNPYYYDPREFEESLSKTLAESVPADKISHIYFYGAGVSSEANKAIVEKAVRSAFPNAVVETHHDLHGAAIALLGNQKGIACILGTGSNSCLWDGQKIVSNVPSLGYLLGDEGSGTYLGKLLVRDVLIGDADDKIAEMFYGDNNLDFSGALDRIYKQPNPNLFFSQQTKFIKENLDRPYFRQLVQRNFNDFIKVQISKYAGYTSLPVSFVGSIAFNFREILEEILSENGISAGKIIKEPMEGMIEYYLGK
ncbi:MAG: ATPase [Chlorobi bacterium]|nr:ATPase [Chlorobiota bacterium]